MNQGDRGRPETGRLEITGSITFPESAVGRPNGGAEQSHRPPNRLWQVIATLVSIAALVFAGLGLRLNKQALAASQRAWVLLDNEAPNRIKTGRAVVYLRNFGHSPATISVITPGMALPGDPVPTPLGMGIADQPIPGPIPERILAPGRRMPVEFTWNPLARPFQLSLFIDYDDPFDSYTYMLCLHPRRPGSRGLVECPYNQRTEQRIGQ